MTKEKVEQLEIDVATIKTEVLNLKEQTESVKSLLKWFIGIGFSILALVIIQLISSSGDRKVMKSSIEHNNAIIRDMASQGIEKGWYKPTELVFRETKKDKT